MNKLASAIFAATVLFSATAQAQMAIPAGIPKFVAISPVFDGVAQNSSVVLHVDGAGCDACAAQKTALDEAYNDIKYIRIQTYRADAAKDAALVAKYEAKPGDVVVIKLGKVVAKESGVTDVAALKALIEKGL